MGDFDTGVAPGEGSRNSGLEEDHQTHAPQHVKTQVLNAMHVLLVNACIIRNENLPLFLENQICIYASYDLIKPYITSLVPCFLIFIFYLLLLHWRVLHAHPYPCPSYSLETVPWLVGNGL